MENLRFYRYDIGYSSSDNNTFIYLSTFKVKAETEKGYWLTNGMKNFKKWIPKVENHNKQYAWATKDRAMVHLINRNIDRVRWYKYWIKESEKAIQIGKHARRKGLINENFDDGGYLRYESYEEYEEESNLQGNSIL